MAKDFPEEIFNFDNIFSQQASSHTNYWTDSRYSTGWQNVGQTPATRLQFDELQRITDFKLQFLKSFTDIFKEEIFTEEGESKIEEVVSQLEKQEVEVVIDPEAVQYYVKLGKSFVMQYGGGITDANGVAKCNFTFDFKATTKADYPTLSENIGIYIPVPIVWVNDCHSYCAGVGSGKYGDTILRKKDSVYVFVSSGQTGLPAPNVDVGVFAFGLAPEAVI